MPPVPTRHRRHHQAQATARSEAIHTASDHPAPASPKPSAAPPLPPRPGRQSRRRPLGIHLGDLRHWGLVHTTVQPHRKPPRAAETACLDTPRAFPSDHARFQYFRTPHRDPDYNAYDDTRLTVTVMSGLPGVGKDTWIATHRPHLPVISLDTLRTELKIKPTDDQRPVINAAHHQARHHLRAGQPFVWNATNLSRQIRQQPIGLAAAYKARIEVIALEAPLDVIKTRNAARPNPVPATVIDRLLNKWEAPDPTEAHNVQWLSTH